MTATPISTVMFCLLLPFTTAAHNIHVGERVAAVGVADKGELLFKEEKFSYKNWNSSWLTGKVRVIQHIAGRSSAKEQNATLIEAIKSARFPYDHYQTTTIVNTDDAIPGTAMFVRSSIESNKQQFPWSQFIVDSHGAVHQIWQLAGGGSVIIVLDKEARVRFVKEGALTQDEVRKVIALLNSLLQ